MFKVVFEPTSNFRKETLSGVHPLLKKLTASPRLFKALMDVGKLFEIYLT